MMDLKQAYDVDSGVGSIDAEFQCGDTVTFHSYHDRIIRAKVLSVRIPGSSFFFYDFFSYKLEGIDKPLITETTGRSIVESHLFEKPVKKNTCNEGLK